MAKNELITSIKRFSNMHETNMKIWFSSAPTFLLSIGMMAERIRPYAVSTERTELGLELTKFGYR